MNTPPPADLRLVIVGATGMAGGYALRCALNHQALELSRRSGEGRSASRTPS
jgi:N-acetyl-gamma-glutamylphosphate reductase